jgi:hypothetical protein
LIHVDGQPSRAWFLQDIAPTDSHSAAVASEGRNCQCRVWKVERPEEEPHLLRWQPSPARR